jgi:uncharacterized membrane-anchored protein YitT (DUF2179 family)
MRSKKKEYSLIVIGTFLMAIAINIVYEPMNMVTGGVSGIAIIIKSVTTSWFDGGVSLWISNILINIPLFIVAGVMKGLQFIKKTLFSTICFTVALYIVPTFKIAFDDYLLASVFGGVLTGIGLGLVFMVNTTTGGTDLFGIVIHPFFRQYTVAQLLFVIDALIVLLGAATFGIKVALYAVIAVFITSKVMDSILEGIKFGKLAFIISENYKEIAEEILNNIDRGVTSIPAKGMYSNHEKKMLLCVVSPKEISILLALVTKIDASAFMIVSDVREVMGEGFIENRQ